MTINLEKFKKEIDEWLDSEDAEAYFKKEEQKHVLKLSRYARFEEYIENNDFDKLLYRIIVKHNDDYREKHYHNGCEPKPNNVLEFIFDYVMDNCKKRKVAKLKTVFKNDVYLFKEYYFQVIYGQGVLFKIINKADMRVILSL